MDFDGPPAGDVADLVAAVRAAGTPQGPRPDPQHPHRPPILPQLPLASRAEADAIVGRVLELSDGDSPTG